MAKVAQRAKAKSIPEKTSMAFKSINAIGGKVFVAKVTSYILCITFIIY